MGRFVSDMGRVDERDENIHIEQVGHGSSSRRLLTMSWVTITPGLRTDSSGTPLRSASSAGGRSERRGNSETNSPVVLFLLFAVGFGARRTPASVAGGGGMGGSLRIKHYPTLL